LTDPVPRSIPRAQLFLLIDWLIHRPFCPDVMKCYDIPLESFEYRRNQKDS